MNIAFTSLIIVLFLLPGIILIRAYFSGVFSDEYIERLDKLSALQLVVRAIMPSLILHYGGLQIGAALTDSELSFFQLINLLVGGKDHNSLALISRDLHDHQLEILGYHAAVNFSAFGLGTLGRVLVRSFRLDRQFPVFRYANEWHYLLSGEILEIQEPVHPLPPNHKASDAVSPPAMPDAPRILATDIDLRYITVVVDVNDQTLLYNGILQNYKLSRSNGLRYLTLSHVHRRALQDDATPGEEGTERYYPLPGNFLVIPFEQIKNLQIEYIQFEKDEGDGSYWLNLLRKGNKPVMQYDTVWVNLLHKGDRS